MQGLIDLISQMGKAEMLEEQWQQCLPETVFQGQMLFMNPFTVLQQHYIPYA